jgi:hypothetical protein
VSVEKAKAADYALRAGHRALEQLAPAEAVKYFTHAVEQAGDSETRERAEALIGLGEAQRQTGIAAFRESLLDALLLLSEYGRPAGRGTCARVRSRTRRSNRPVQRELT